MPVNLLCFTLVQPFGAKPQRAVNWKMLDTSEWVGSMKLGAEVRRFDLKENIERGTLGILVTDKACTFLQKITFQKVYAIIYQLIQNVMLRKVCNITIA